MAPRDTTPLDDEHALAQRPEDDDDLDDDEEDSSGDFLDPDSPPYGDDDDDYDPDLDDLNNPDVTTLGEAPLIGGSPQSTDVFGSQATSIGRVSSPKLYAQASQFPTAVQFRAWRWENGIPVALGAIDIEASEEDFVRMFYGAMPQRGDGKFMYKLRPVDVRGKELGKEVTLTFSEHHNEVQRIRRQKEEEQERSHHMDPMIIQQGEAGGGAAYAEEMGRMFEQAVDSAERRTELLQTTLEQERGRLREEEKSRYQERIAVADRSTEVVTKMTDRLMETDRARSDEQMKAQQQQNQLMLSTVTTVFQQQQEAARGQAERLRENDTRRMEQDRAFFERQRQEMEARRAAEAAEAERRRKQDQDEWDRRMQRDREESERKTTAERLDFERKADRERQEQERRAEQDRLRVELEQKRLEEQRTAEVERLRTESQRQDKLIDTRMERERLEAERRREESREERERWYREIEQKRLEEDRKRQAEKEEWERRERERREESERKAQLLREEFIRQENVRREEAERKERERREESERRERLDRERMERERQEFQIKMERERQENERREASRREEAERIEARRREEVALQKVQLEMSAQKDREHAERMLEMSRLERESQREAQERREKLEREAREQADRDRQRQHDMAIREMEMAKERDREHQERMLQLSKIQGGGGSLLGTLGESLGMETTEVLGRIFGGGGSGEEGSGPGWADAIPKVLGSLAELGKAAMTVKAQQAQAQQVQTKGRRQLPAGARIVQTEQGPRVLLPGGPTAMPMPMQHVQSVMDLPHFPQVPPGFEDDDDEVEDVETEPAVGPEGAEAPHPAPEEEPAEEAAEQAAEIDTLARASAAGMSLSDQKKARKALRALASKLDEAPEEDWLGVITEAITSEMTIYDYIKAVTVLAAIQEASSGNQSLAERAVSALRDSGLPLPDDIPFDETDYARIHGEK